MPDLAQLQKLWQLATEQLKKRTSSIPLWQAMESVVVLDAEGSTLVIGLGGENFSRSGHLTIPESRNLIEEILRQITGQPVSFRVVECASPEEWSAYKVQEERKRAAAIALTETKQRRRDEAPAEPVAETPQNTEALPGAAVKNVNDILDRAYAIFAALPHRTLSQSRARFVHDAAQMLAGAEGQLISSGMSPDAIARTIDRAIDKIAVWGECDATTVALEYLRHKERG